MAQKRWKYVSNRTNVYIIGIYHNWESGHCMIYANNEIIDIEFNVLEGKQKSFFVDEELLYIDIVKHLDGYEYSLLKSKEKKSRFLHVLNSIKQWIKA